MKYVIYSLLAASLICTSCHKDPVVLEFDETFHPKAPTKGERDALPPIDVLTKILSFTSADSKILVQKIKQDDESFIVKDIPNSVIRIKLNQKADKPLKFNVVPMTAENSPKEYQSIVKGSVQAIPETTYSFLNTALTIEADQKEASFTLQFNKDEFTKLDTKGEYVLPLMIVPEDKDVIVPNFYVVRFSIVTTEVLPTGDNVEESQEISDPWSWISGNSLNLNSNYQSSHLWKLIDNKTNTGSWWIDSTDPSIWLSVSIDKLKLIKGFAMHGDPFSMEVLASNDGGISYVSQGTLTLNNGNMHVVKFIKPIKINALKFQNFKSGTQWRDIYELKLISE